MLDGALAYSTFYNPQQLSSLNSVAASVPQTPAVVGSAGTPAAAASTEGSASAFQQLDAGMQALLLQLQSATGSGAADPAAAPSGGNTASGPTTTATTADQDGTDAAGDAFHHHGHHHHRLSSAAQSSTANGSAPGSATAASANAAGATPSASSLAQDFLAAAKSYAMTAANTNPAALAALSLL